MGVSSIKKGRDGPKREGEAGEKKKEKDVMLAKNWRRVSVPSGVATALLWRMQDRRWKRSQYKSDPGFCGRWSACTKISG